MRFLEQVKALHLHLWSVCSNLGVVNTETSQGRLYIYYFVNRIHFIFYLWFMIKCTKSTRDTRSVLLCGNTSDIRYTREKRICHICRDICSFCSDYSDGKPVTFVTVLCQTNQQWHTGISQMMTPFTYAIGTLISCLCHCKVHLLQPYVNH